MFFQTTSEEEEEEEEAEVFSRWNSPGSDAEM